MPSYPPRPFNLPLYFKQTLQNKPLSTLFSSLIINHGKFFSAVVYCSERKVSSAWWGQHFNNIILEIRNFIFLKIIILTFQSFNRREEKIKWRYIFPYRYDLYKENIFFNNTEVWRFDLFIEEKKKYNEKCFSISLICIRKEKRQLLNNSVFRFSDVVLLLSMRKWLSK